MNLDLTEPELRTLLASVGTTYIGIRAEQPNHHALPELITLYEKLHAAHRMCQLAAAVGPQPKTEDKA